MSKLFYMVEPITFQAERDVITVEGAGYYKNIPGLASLRITSEAIELPDDFLSNQLKNSIEEIQKLKKQNDELQRKLENTETLFSKLEKQVYAYSGWVVAKFFPIYLEKDISFSAFKESLREGRPDYDD